MTNAMAKSTTIHRLGCVTRRWTMSGWTLLCVCVCVCFCVCVCLCVCVCVCVCACVWLQVGVLCACGGGEAHDGWQHEIPPHTHTHTHSLSLNSASVVVCACVPHPSPRQRQHKRPPYHHKAHHRNPNQPLRHIPVILLACAPITEVHKRVQHVHHGGNESEEGCAGVGEEYAC